MAAIIDLSKTNIGDQVVLGDEKYEIAGMDAPWESNFAMKLRSVTLHLKAMGYAGVTQAEDIRGTAEFQATLQNDPTTRDDLQVNPPVFKDEKTGKIGPLENPDDAKKDASQNGTATDDTKDRGLLPAA